MTHVALKLSLAAFSLLLASSNLLADDVVQFRSDAGQGVSSEQGLPTEWSDTQNLVWRTELPGGGSSSPIVLGDRIFLTCYTGYGLDEKEPGKTEDLTRHVVCVDRGNGKILWQKPYATDGKEPKYQGNGARHGYSTSTCTSDGERLFVFFGRHGVFCLDPKDGTELWKTSVGDGDNSWGSATSLVLFENLLLVNASIESKSLVALDKATGKQVWQADGIRGSWNTPLLVEVPGGQTEVVLCLPEQVLGLNPKTGEKLWECEGIPDGGYVCPSVVANDGVVYAIGGRKNTALAVKAGGRGDVTKTHLLWTTGAGSNVVSPVYHNGHLYWMHERSGVANCLDAATGKIVYQERVEPRPGTVYSSVLLADGKLYYVSQHDGTFVVAAKPEFELIAVNKFESDESRANACAVAHNGQLLIRSDKYLHCVGK